jgi:sulfatase modifying factor 1
MVRQDDPTVTKALAWFAITGALSVVSPRTATAAESFDCGADGKPNASTAKYDCASPKVELTTGKVSRCIVPQVRAPSAPKPLTAPPPPANTCAAGDHDSDGHCCHDGEDWFAKGSKCVCVQADQCKKPHAPGPKVPTAPIPSIPPPPAGPTCPPDMVLLGGARYWVGSNEAQGALGPQQIALPPYCLDKNLVTVSDYDACVASGACSPAPTTVLFTFDENVTYSRDTNATLTFWSRFCNEGHTDRQDNPINCIDWKQASSFCEAVGKRLPSEQEWEVAARGPEGRHYAWGNDATTDNGCYARFDFNLMDGQGTCPVGSHPKGNTSTGLSDMTGNVWEFTSTVENWRPVDRGGSWNNGDKLQIAATFRANNTQQRRSSNLGFRCAR